MKAMERGYDVYHTLRQTLESGWEVLARQPAVPVLAECAGRLLLGVMLSAARVFDTYSPFALGFVAASGSGLGGFAALVGASLGYLSTLGLVSGLRYVSAAIFIYAVAFAFYDMPVYQKRWFVPLCGGVVGALTGFLYLSELGWHRRDLLAFGTEVLLITGSAFLYRLALQPWTEPETPADRRWVGAGLLYLGGTLAAALRGIALFGQMGLGIALSAAAVLLLARRSGTEAVSAGVVLGLVLDLCCGGGGLYTGALAFGALLAGAVMEKSRWLAGLGFFAGGCAAALWNGPAELQVSLVLDMGAAAAIVSALPDRVLPVRARDRPRASPPLQALPVPAYPSYTKRQLQDKLTGQAAAYRTLYEDMRGGLDRPPDPAQRLEQVFDRAAEQVCQDCPRYPLCWKQDYHDTYQAFQRLLSATRQRGYGKLSDAPISFLSVCSRAGELVSAANVEYASLLHRRQMEARLRTSREAVWRQYAQLSELLGRAAKELEYDLTPDPQQAQPVLRFLKRHGLEADIRLGRDLRGRLVLQMTGEDLSSVQDGPLLEALSRNMGMSFALGPLERDRAGQRLTLVQEDNYQATAGVAALSKEGETVSGDGGNWFRDKDGRLWVVLCDGMGSGRLAAEQSHLALRLLEDFLRAGVSPEIALATLSNALALRGEQEVGFTTIDLVGLDLFSGEGQSYKLGAGPTYLRQSGRVKKLSGTSLPAGLEFGQRAEPDVCSFQLGGEDLAVMVSDGILDGEEDDWIWPLIRDHRDKSPKELAARILERSPGGRDDRTVLVLQLSKRSKAPNRVRAKAAS